MAGDGFLLSVCGRSRSWRACEPYLNPMDSVCLRTASMEWNVPGKHGPHGELFFFLIQKEPALAPVGETFSPLLQGRHSYLLLSLLKVLKKCALVALHLIAEEGRGGEDGCHRPLVWVTIGKWAAQRVQCGRVKSEAWSEDESVSSSGSRESNVGNEALHVIGLYGPGDKISLFLKDWELAKVALSCHMGPWTCSARKCMRPGSWVMPPRGLLSLHECSLSHRGRAVTAKERVGCTRSGGLGSLMRLTQASTEVPAVP